MSLAYFFYKGLLETGIGNIINKFKIHKRRDILFFEELISEYVKACRDNGFSDEMLKVGEEWGRLAAKTLIPSAILSRSVDKVYNDILSKVWKSIDLVRGLELKVKGDKVFLIVFGESGTRIIGENPIALGFHKGTIEAVLGKELKILKSIQTPEQSYYEFEITDKKIGEIKSKHKKEYFQLNKYYKKGFDVKQALKKRIITLKGNELFLRGKKLSPFENTYFHLFGIHSKGIELLVPVSEKFFEEMLVEESSEDEKLRFLKNLLQFMGWGEVKFLVEESKVTLLVEHPPYGFQKEKDNWLFLVKMTEGFLKAIYPKTRLSDYSFQQGRVTAKYLIR